MKTKKLFLMAAMLLMSVCTFAQNNTSLKGDVNEDGKVDVGDIVAVINVMKNGEVGYFYLGTQKPTAANYTSLPGVISTYTSIDETIGSNATAAVGETIYLLCPTSWMIGKNVALEDNSAVTIDFLSEKDDITISGYTIYKTNALNTSATVTLIQIYKWYTGFLATPAKTSWSESDFNQTSTKPITSFTVIDEGLGFNIWIVPTAWGTLVSMKVDGETRNPWQTPIPWNPTLPEGYVGYHADFSRNSQITDIVWKK